MNETLNMLNWMMLKIIGTLKMLVFKIELKSFIETFYYKKLLEQGKELLQTDEII
jgi:hypothetical protein